MLLFAIISAVLATDSLEKQYSQALAQAKYPSYSKISRSLTPITSFNPDLNFDSHGRVLMAHFGVLSSFNYSVGDTFPLKDIIWLTVFPDLKKSCVEYPKNKTLRTLQALGMPPTNPSDGVVELYVSMQDIFRPCPDPEISDRECQVEIPLLGTTSHKHTPWYCPKQGEAIQQQSAEWVKVNEAHLTWMCNNWLNSYNKSEVFSNYPWTALGYTYDWGGSNYVGLSEFIAKKGALVTLHSISSTEDYCE